MIPSLSDYLTNDNCKVSVFKTKIFIFKIDSTTSRFFLRMFFFGGMEIHSYTMNKNMIILRKLEGYVSMYK